MVLSPNSSYLLLTMNVVAFMLILTPNAGAFRREVIILKRYSNLRAEMARHNVEIGHLAELLNLRRGAVGNKINGRSRFFYDEAVIIKNHFFPNCELEYLFESDDHKTA